MALCPPDRPKISHFAFGLGMHGVMRDKTKRAWVCQTMGPPRLPFPRLQRSAKLYFLADREPTLMHTTKQLDIAFLVWLLASYLVFVRLHEYLERGIHLSGPVKP